MKSNLYVGIVIVKVKAPKGYKPSTMTFKFGIILDKKSEKLLETIKEEHLNSVKTQLEQQNPKIVLDCTAELTLTSVTGFSADYYQIDKRLKKKGTKE